MPITEIGVVSGASDGIIVIGTDNQPMELEFKGYEHFKKINNVFFTSVGYL